MTGAQKGLVVGQIQPRSMYSYSYFRISANLIHPFGTVKVLVVICAHILGPFYVWCFYSPDSLVSKTCLYSFHIDVFLCEGVSQVFHCPLVLGAAVKLGH